MCSTKAMGGAGSECATLSRAVVAGTSTGDHAPASCRHCKCLPGASSQRVGVSLSEYVCTCSFCGSEGWAEDTSLEMGRAPIQCAQEHSFLPIVAIQDFVLVPLVPRKLHHLRHGRLWVCSPSNTGQGRCHHTHSGPECDEDQ